MPKSKHLRYFFLFQLPFINLYCFWRYSSPLKYSSQYRSSITLSLISYHILGRKVFCPSPLSTDTSSPEFLLLQVIIFSLFPPQHTQSNHPHAIQGIFVPRSDPNWSVLWLESLGLKYIIYTEHEYVVSLIHEPSSALGLNYHVKMKIKRKPINNPKILFSFPPNCATKSLVWTVCQGETVWSILAE